METKKAYAMTIDFNNDLHESNYPIYISENEELLKRRFPYYKNMNPTCHKIKITIGKKQKKGWIYALVARNRQSGQDNLIAASTAKKDLKALIKTLSSISEYEFFITDPNFLAEE